MEPINPRNTNHVQPTIDGCFVETTWDALLLLQGCLAGQLVQVGSRPHAQDNLVRSGQVYVYEEVISGIKRWTDGVTWSPSRVLGNFLIYRELEKDTPQAERKSLVRSLQQKNADSGDVAQATTDDATSATTSASVEGFTDDETKSLLGALTNTYRFKQAGIMMKKTISIKIDGFHHHLISYYDPHDVKNGSLRKPSDLFPDKFLPGPALVGITFKVPPLDELQQMRPDVLASVHQFLPHSIGAISAAADMAGLQQQPHHHHHTHAHAHAHAHAHVHAYAHPHARVQMSQLFADQSMQSLGYMNPLSAHHEAPQDLFAQFQFPRSMQQQPLLSEPHYMHAQQQPLLPEAQTQPQHQHQQHQQQQQQQQQQPMLSEPQYVPAQQRALSYPNGEAYGSEHAQTYSIGNHGSTHIPFPRHPDNQWAGPEPE